MIQIGNYPKGYNLTLLNTIYHYPKKLNNGSWSPDSMDLIIKDNDTGDKFLETIEKPEYLYYLIKDTEFIDHHMDFIEKEKCDAISVPYRYLLKDIAERTNCTAFYYSNIENGTRSNNRRLNHHNRVMMSDMDIEDNFRFKFANSYTNTLGPISKSYLDIEADTINCAGDFVELGECPINAVSFIDDQTLTIHSFLLRNENNPLIAEFEKIANTNQLQEELLNFIIDAVGGMEAATKYKITSMTIKFHFYDEQDEILLIRDLFNYINSIKPDFVLAWNMAFDIPYIIQRIINLGHKPNDIMCHPDFRYKEVNYMIDERNKNVFEERNDYAKISSYSVFLDQLIQYASRRKGGSAIASYKLDYIGEITCGVKKLDYKHITNSLPELPYKDYKTFVFYNIMDTIVQYCIEFKVNDINCIYNEVLVQNTRYAKIHRQTVYLKNRAAKSYYKNGFIIGNNVNGNNPKVPFPGAFVSDPKLNSNYSRSNINGQYLSIYDNLNDFDYRALYPSITSEFNIGSNTQIAHLNIPEKVFDQENRFQRSDIKWKREAQFMDDLQSHNWMEFFHRWFNFANYDEMYEDVIEYFTKIKRPMGKLYAKNFSSEPVSLFKQRQEDISGSVFIQTPTERDKLLLETIYRNKSDINIPSFNIDPNSLNYDRGLSHINPKDNYLK